MSEEYSFKGVAETCGPCEKAFDAAESLFSALHREEEGYVRLDFCASCWEKQPKEPLLCFWKRKARTKETQPTVDGSVVFDIFQKLDGAENRHDQNFRYILGLLLMRRKRLKFIDVDKTEDGEFLVLEDRRLQDVKYRLLDPGLSEDEMQHAKDQVGKLFSMNVNESDEEEKEDGQANEENHSEVHQS